MRRSFVATVLVTIALGLFGAVALAQDWPRGGWHPPGGGWPPGGGYTVPVTIRNTFIIEGVRIEVYGESRGRVEPRTTETFRVPPNTWMTVVPDISPGVRFPVRYGGVYEVWAPGGPGTIEQARIRRVPY